MPLILVNGRGVAARSAHTCIISAVHLHLYSSDNLTVSIYINNTYIELCLTIVCLIKC